MFRFVLNNAFSKTKKKQKRKIERFKLAEKHVLIHQFLTMTQNGIKKRKEWKSKNFREKQ